MKNLMMAAAVAVLAFGVFGDDVEYWDCAGSSNLTVSATCITNLITEGGTLSSGWYYIDGTNKLASSLCCEGTVRIILKDGARLVVNGSEFQAALIVGESAELEIYGQESGTGELVANGADYGAGIGGVDGFTYRDGCCGKVTINGGTVTATGGYLGAGIGGGYYGDGGAVTINGGTVTATGGASGAGIGAGYTDEDNDVAVDGGTVTINGGTVTATGGYMSAGIGGGQEASGGTVTISGGRVIANGGDDGKDGIGGANIGRGNNGPEDGTVVITGGIFGMEVEDEWYDAAQFEVVANRDPETKAVYPWAVALTGSSPTSEGGTCEWDDAAGAWVVTPADGVTTVTVGNLPAGEKVAVPPSVTQVKGVGDERIRVRSGAYDVTGAFTVKGGAIALDPAGSVDGVPVTPTIGAVGESATEPPFAVGGESVALTVRTIPGLVYALRRGSSPRRTDGGWGTVGEPVVGDGTAKTLSDTGSLPDKAFYVVVVSVPGAVAAKNAAR